MKYETGLEPGTIAPGYASLRVKTRTITEKTPPKEIPMFALRLSKLYRIFAALATLAIVVAAA
ncbi:MAG TPA: hypothetical protein VF498_12925, partial [Anaerolineales bacterium]